MTLPHERPLEPTSEGNGRRAEQLGTAEATATAQLAAIVQSTADAIVSVTLDGDITSWNPGAARMFGYPRDEILGCHLSVLVPEDASADVEDLLAAALAGVPGARDTHLVRRDGSVLDVALTVSALRDATGRVTGSSAVLRDITARKKAEVALRQALEQEYQRERQQAAAAEIRLALLSDTPDDALHLICGRANDLLDTSSASILLAENDGFRVLASIDQAARGSGTGAAAWEALATAVVATGKPVRAQSPAELGAAPAHGGPALGAPVVFDGEVRGALTAVRESGAPGFSADDAQLAASLADQASLGLQLARARADRERLLLVGDRERIARDLHDVVIQRLFAGGMALQNLLALTADARHRQRLKEVVDELDTTIREIRSTIFELAPPPGAAQALRAEVLRVGHDSAAALGFAPTFRFDGPIDTSVSDDLAHHLLAVLREGLTNVARHAGATRVDVEITATDHVGLVLVDDGQGFRPGCRQSGVANMRRRAEELGGRLQIRSSPGSGTRLEWWVPLVR